MHKSDGVKGAPFFSSLVKIVFQSNVSASVGGSLKSVVRPSVSPSNHNYFWGSLVAREERIMIPMSGELSMFSFLFWRFRCKIVNLHLQAWSSTQTRTQTRTDLKLSSGFQIRKGNLDEDDGWLWLLSIFSWSTTYEDLLSTNQHFPRRIALAVSPLLLAQAPPFSAPVSAFDPACFFSRRWWIFWWTSGTKTGSSTEARGWFSLSLSL